MHLSNYLTGALHVVLKIVTLDVCVTTNLNGHFNSYNCDN